MFDFVFLFPIDYDGIRASLTAAFDGAFVIWLQKRNMKDVVTLHSLWELKSCGTVPDKFDNRERAFQLVTKLFGGSLCCEISAIE